ncbi:MAG: DUF2339 domain-containing protein [Lentisphaerae bacterium]|nr:DUF2339 domain-containing protein [Lentisphaerota bacterium]
MHEEILILFLLILGLLTLAAPVVTVILVISLRQSFKEFKMEMALLQDRVEDFANELKTFLRQNASAPGGQEGAAAVVPPPETAPVPPPLPPPPIVVLPPPSKTPPPLPPSVLLSAAPHDEVPPVHPEAPAEVVSPPSSERMTAVREILRRLWDWILVGEEYRPANMSMEYAVATTWLMRAGIVAIVACVGYFLKWSIERELIGPYGRVAVAIVVGMVMLGAGIRLMTRRWHVLGQGFIGGGLATLYFALFAAGPFYKLIPIPGAFAAMILVTVTAGILAARLNSMLVAIFGIIGGFCTPFLLRTGQPHFLALYAYILLLDLGILGISHVRQWRLLNYLGFVFSYFLFFGTWGRLDPHRDFPLAISFLSLLFVIQSVQVYTYNLIRGLRTTLLEIAHLLLNAGLFSLTAYAVIRDAVGRPWPAIMTLALAVFYMLHVGLFLRRRLLDRPLLLTLIALAGLYAVLTLPIVMEKESLTIAWSLLAFLFLWLGRRMDSAFLCQLGYALYGCVAFRLLCWDMPRNYSHGVAPIPPMADYWQTMLSRLWTFGLALGSLACAFILERRARGDSRAPVVDPGNDVPGIVSVSAGRQVLFWSLVVMLFLYFHLEFWAMLNYFTPLRPAVSTWLWCGLAVFFLLNFRWSGRLELRMALFICLGAVAVKSLFWDLPVWHVRGDALFDTTYSPLLVGMRWLDFLAILGLFCAVWLSLVREPETPFSASVMGYGGLFLLFLYATLEGNSLLYWKLRDFQGGGVSVLWTMFALGFVGGGIWKNLRGLRYAGLVLFVVVFAKVVFSDLAGMAVIYRVLAFFILGVLLLLGSFAYLYASRKFVQTPAPEKPPALPENPMPGGDVHA